MMSGHMLRALGYALLVMAGILHAPIASADVPITADSRIKTLVFNENEVYSVTTHYGYQANIEFGRNENIEAVSVGDRVGWQIVPAGRRLFIRAMEENAHTNMTIVTNKRAYQFDLHSSASNAVFGSEELTYVLRFYYPDLSGAPAPPASFAAPAHMAAAQTQPPSGAAFIGSQAPGGLPAPLPRLPQGRYGSGFSGMPAANLPSPLPRSGAPFASKNVAVSPVVEPLAPIASAPVSPLQPYGNPSARTSHVAAAPAPAASHVSAANAPMAVSAMPELTRTAPPSGSIQDITAAPSYNYRYTYSGPDSAAPLKIYDDGASTYFKFSAPPVGATFTVVDKNGAERVVPYSVTNDGMAVIRAVGSRVKLNQPSGQVTVYNEAMG